jgi:uncharacterized protein (DUF58 family)
MTDGRFALQPRREPRLLAYGVLATIGLTVGLLAGRGAPIAMSAPFVVALLFGLRDVRPMTVDVQVDVDDAVILEGDECTVTVRLTIPAPLRALVRFEAHRDVAVIAPDPPTWDLPPGTRRAELVVRVRADEWGRYRLGRVLVEASLPAGLIRWQAEVGNAPVTRVLPRPMRLQQLMDPSAKLVSTGAHRSKAVGAGSDFAEVRPFVVGDRLRDLNWRATARLGTPHVNRHHPERASEVVLLVDAFGDRSGELSPAGRDAVARCARAAWTVSRVHLAAQDRVGFLAHGRGGAWLPPDNGDRARYRLLDHVLTVATAPDRQAVAAPSTRTSLRSNALVIAFTPLWDRRIMRDLQVLDQQGHDLVVIVVDTADLVESGSAVEAGAAHLWSMLLEDRRMELHRSGITQVAWSPDTDLGPTIARLRTLHRPNANRIHSVGRR